MQTKNNIKINMQKINEDEGFTPYPKTPIEIPGTVYNIKFIKTYLKGQMIWKNLISMLGKVEKVIIYITLS